MGTAGLEWGLYLHYSLELLWRSDKVCLQGDIRGASSESRLTVRFESALLSTK